jgi:hypothetical protein
MERQEEKFDCNSFRDLYARKELGGTISDADSARGSEHVSTCVACSSYAKQHEMIIHTMSSLPQFDVSEKLTQSILQAVQVEGQSRTTDLLLPIGSAAALVFFALVPFDSIQGWLSWGMGLIGLCGLQVLLKSAERSESAS